MKILAFAGSTSSQSKNKALVSAVLKSFKDDDCELLDLNDFEMPLYSEDREKQGYPEPAQKFVDAIAGADAIICSFAEHNRSYASGFKNIFDWSSRINKKLFQNKPMFVMSTSPGAYGGGHVMAEAQKYLPEFGADIRETFSLPSFNDNFDMQKLEISNTGLRAELDQKIQNFKKGIGS